MLRNFLYVLLGIVLAVAIACLTVAIACAVNGLSFGAQVTEWFGTSANIVGSNTNTATLLIGLV